MDLLNKSYFMKKCIHLVKSGDTAILSQNTPVSLKNLILGYAWNTYVNNLNMIFKSFAYNVNLEIEFASWAELLCRLLFWLGNPLKSFPRGHLVVVVSLSSPSNKASDACPSLNTVLLVMLNGICNSLKSTEESCNAKVSPRMHTIIHYKEVLKS